MNARQSVFRKMRRRWLLLPALVLLTAGGVVAYRIHVGPQLQPVARYHYPTKWPGCPLFFSAQGMGYPAVATVMVKVGGNLEPRNRVLDDLCRPLDVTVSGSNVSPTRETIAWSVWSGMRGKFNFYFRRRDGRQAHVPCPTYGVQSEGPVPYSDGVFGYLYSGKIDRVWLYTPDGRSLPPPIAGDLTLANGIAGADDRFIPLTDRKRLLLYDRTAKKIVLTTPFPWNQVTMIWHHKERLLLVPRSGNALVYDKLRLTATLAPGADGWRWGEDGTVWTLTGGALQVLRWRTGTPALVNIPTRGKSGARYGSLAPGLESIPPFRENIDPDWAAAWGDGRLVAGVENLAPAANRLVHTVVRTAGALHIKLSIPGETRRLTLYRDNRRLGSFLLHAKQQFPSPPMWSWVLPKTANHEHLAFTADGRCLSWAIDDGTGVRLFVFQVPPA